MRELVKVYLGLPSEEFEPPRKISLKTIASELEKNITRGQNVRLYLAKSIIFHPLLGTTIVGLSLMVVFIPIVI